MIDCRQAPGECGAAPGSRRVAVNTPLPPGHYDILSSGPFPPAILYEDAQLLAVAKPAGLVTHPAYKHPDGTLADLVFDHQAARGERRPWLLHRLDRETSGVVLFAKTEVARRALVRQFERRLVRKRYFALTFGLPPERSGEIDAPLMRDPIDRRRVIVSSDGQSSRTRYSVLATNKPFALVAVEPLTGRTHQIRAHLAMLGAPIAGDQTYLPQSELRLDGAERTLLHAWRVEFLYPGTGSPCAIAAPVPDDFMRHARSLALDTALDQHVHDVQEDSCSLPRSIK